jgi:hypothetical protein
VNTEEANVNENVFVSLWLKSKLKSTVMLSPAATYKPGLIVSNCRIEGYVNGKSIKE